MKSFFLFIILGGSVLSFFLPSVSSAQNITPSLYPDRPTLSAASLAIGTRQALLLNDQPFNPTVTAPEAAPPGFGNALQDVFYLGAGATLPILNEVTNLSDSNTSKEELSSYFFQFKFNVRRSYFQFYSDKTNLSWQQNNTNQTWLDAHRLISFGYLLRPDWTFGLSYGEYDKNAHFVNQNYNAPDNIEKDTRYETGTTYNLWKILYIGASLGLVTAKYTNVSDALNYYETMLGVSMETPVAIFNNLHVEYSAADSGQAKGKEGLYHPPTREYFKIVEAQIGQFVVGYSGHNVRELRTYVYQKSMSPSYRIKDSVRVDYSYLNSSLRTGVEVSDNLYQYMGNTSFFVRELALVQGFVF